VTLVTFNFFSITPIYIAFFIASLVPSIFYIYLTIVEEENEQLCLLFVEKEEEREKERNERR